MFPITSRYYGVGQVERARRDGAKVVYLRRRFVPPPERFQLLQEHSVTEGERHDTIAAQYLGDPEQWWRWCDENIVRRPEELTEEIGGRLRSALPEGIPGVRSP